MGDLADQSEMIDTAQLDVHWEILLRTVDPLRLYDSIGILGLKGHCVGAVSFMDLNAVFDGDKTKNVITRYGIATRG